MVGHATVLIQAAGCNILTDPVWSDRASPVAFAGPRRVTAPGVAFEDLPRIDAVLVSHCHYDHLDLGTLARLHARDRPLKRDRKSTRLNPVTNAHLVCRLLLEKKNSTHQRDQQQPLD